MYKLFSYESELLFDVNYCYYCIPVKVYPNDLEMTGSDFDSILEKKTKKTEFEFCHVVNKISVKKLIFWNYEKFLNWCQTITVIQSRF